jgi:hypothetical protein
MFEIDRAIAEYARELHALGFHTEVPVDELESHLHHEVEQWMKFGLCVEQAFGAAADKFANPEPFARPVEKLFVLGPDSRLSEGIVGVRDASRWKSYLEREGLPPLSCPTDFKSILRVNRVLVNTPGAPLATFRLEYDNPEADESLFPEVVTWRIYFRDVHGIEADSTSELVLALQLAGWSDQRIARYSAIELDEAIDDHSPEYEEHNENTLEFTESNDVYVGPGECAFALIQELTGSFPSESPAESVVGRLQLFSDQIGVREVHAIGEITLTALQELFNTLHKDIRVQFTDPFPPSSSFCMTRRNEEIASIVADRMGLTGPARDWGIQQLALPARLTQFKQGEIVGDVSWMREQEGYQGGGRGCFDLRQPMHDFIEECRRFTFGDFYDHCPASHEIYRDTTVFADYHVWLFRIDLVTWTISPMTDEVYAKMQSSPNSLERWVAVFSEPQPPPQHIDYLSRYCWRNSNLPYTKPFALDTKIMNGSEGL